MMITNVKENLVVGGFFGCVIGILFLAFGQVANFLCEMMFWTFVGYVAVTYFEIIPDFAKSLMKKHSFVANCLTYFAWVPLVVGGAVVLFLGSLLFIDYNVVELNCLLKSAKIVLTLMMGTSLLLALIKKTDYKIVFI
ncbi:MAG: hypothetical protein IKA30_01320 [Alphaproteobacteria bacterium]|nr:hypothetical protein [Alphaproteobacteria bacterium]